MAIITCIKPFFVLEPLTQIKVPLKRE